MIVPDKKSELYLSRQIQEKDIRCLCHAGVLPSGNFLRAVALCRSEKDWKLLGLKILLASVFLCFGLAAFFFFVSEWVRVYTTSCIVFLAFLFIVCSCLRHFAAADYAGVIVIGAMIFWPDLIFGMNVFLYKQFFMWFFLSVFWAVSSSRTWVRLMPLFFLNATIGLYGWHFILPSFKMHADTFCMLAAILNLLLMLLREKLKETIKGLDASSFRFMPLIFICLFLLTGSFFQVFFGNGTFAFVYCFIFTAIAGYVFVIKDFDWFLCRVLSVFCVLWFSFLLYRGAEIFSASQNVFFVLETIFLTLVLVTERRFTVWLKDKKNDD